MAASSGKRAPLASMGSVDPPDPDTRSLGSDSVFLKNEDEEQCVDTEDEVSGFSTDSDAPGPSCRRFLRVPSRKKRIPEKWDGCAGCVPRRRAGNKPSVPPSKPLGKFLLRILTKRKCCCNERTSFLLRV